MFTPEELKNIAALMARVNITGNEAITVALLQQKIATLTTPTQQPQPTSKESPKEAEGKKA